MDIVDQKIAMQLRNDNFPFLVILEFNFTTLNTWLYFFEN